MQDVPPMKNMIQTHTKTIKHGGSSIKFSYYDAGSIYWIKEIMDRHLYVKILHETMLPYCKQAMPLIWIFLQDNDSKYTSALAKHRINAFEWPP